MPVSYLTLFDYINAPEGLETASLLGNQMRLSSAVVAGGTSLPIMPNTTVPLVQFDPITIYDGLSSEVVQVASSVNIGVSSIPLLSPGLQFNHVQYSACSSKGILGDLGAEILKGSAWVENITRQTLWSTTQLETLRLPSMRASFDNQNVLTFRTKQYPITAISAIQMGTIQNNFVSYDPTQAFIDSNEVVTVPQLLATGSGSSTYSLIAQQVSRQQNAYLQVTYTAGYTATTMPKDVVDAAILLTSSLLARRNNPIGGDSLRTGDIQIQATQRGDNTGESLLIKNARNLLANYTLRVF